MGLLLRLHIHQLLKLSETHSLIEVKPEALRKNSLR